MTEKILNTRIINKHDTEAHWSLATNFIPKQGELIVYDVDSTHTYERFKIGDGVTLVSELPFALENELINKVNTDDIFEEKSFGWTDFESTVPKDEFGLMGEISDNTIVIFGTGHPVVVHCAGKTLGFTFSINGYSDAYLTINGITATYTNSAYDGSEFATNIVIPPTYMESDIEFSGSMNVWTFTDMTIQNVKGVTELEEQIGDIDTALDAILEIQDELIGGNA